MITSILSILGAIGGLAGLITLVKFLMTSKSFQKQAREEADSVAIKNIKEAFDMFKESMNKRSESQRQEIEELKSKVKFLEDEILKSNISLKTCFKEKFDLEEYAEKMQSAFDVSGICEYIISGHDCPVIERYKKLFSQISNTNDKTLG